MRGCVVGRWRAVFGVLLIAALMAAPAAAKSSKKKASAHGGACADSDDKPDFPWQQFKVGDTCVEFTNTLTAVYQNLMRSSGNLPPPRSRGTASSDNPRVTTFTYKPSLVTTTPTAAGDFKTTFELSVAIQQRRRQRRHHPVGRDGRACRRDRRLYRQRDEFLGWRLPGHRHGALAHGRGGALRARDFREFKAGPVAGERGADLGHVVDRVCADPHRRPGARRALALRNRPVDARSCGHGA